MKNSILTQTNIRKLSSVILKQISSVDDFNTCHIITRIIIDSYEKCFPYIEMDEEHRTLCYEAARHAEKRFTSNLHLI